MAACPTEINEERRKGEREKGRKGEREKGRKGRKGRK